MLTNLIQKAKAYIGYLPSRLKNYLEYERTHEPTPRQNLEMFCALMFVIILFLIADVIGH
jgi:hypothetical protein